MFKPCPECADDYPLKGGMLLGRDEAWAKGWHTHKRGGGLEGYFLFRDDGILGKNVKDLGDVGRFPWEEGYEQELHLDV